MPHLRIETSCAIALSESDTLIANAADLVSQSLEKSPDYIQVILDDGKRMQFGGSSDPNAFVSLISLGLTDEHAETLSKALCELLKELLGISPDRVFLAFHDHPRERFGWNGKTFA